MRALKIVSVAAVLAASAAHAEGETLAWQTPGYVMEEIVVTAPAPAETSPLGAAPEIYNNEWVVNARVPVRLAQFLSLHERSR